MNDIIGYHVVFFHPVFDGVAQVIHSGLMRIYVIGVASGPVVSVDLHETGK
jgi:hypothetical protein